MERNKPRFDMDIGHSVKMRNVQHEEMFDSFAIIPIDKEDRNTVNKIGKFSEMIFLP